MVLDNPVSSTGQALNTHRPASLYETFEPKEARRVIQRLEFLSQPAQQLQYLGQRPAQALLPAILSPSLVKASHLPDSSSRIAYS